MSYILDCRYDTRASFYGKAIVEEKETKKTISRKLYSYGTLVAEYKRNLENNKRTYTCYGKYSCTTTRHQKEFFKQNGLWDKEIKELFNKGTLEIGE